MAQQVCHKICPTCGISFTTTAPRRVYCSDTCKRGKKTCVLCGTVFVPTKNTTGKYCSKKCWYAHYANKNNKKCLQCGKDFHASRSVQKYCSDTCRQNALKPPPKPCKHCGQPVPPSVQRRTFCSTLCSSEFTRLKNEGNLAARKKVKPVGTKRVNQGGYILVKQENGKWIPEHRLVMEKYLGRKLLPTESVHHRDGDRKNNAIKNLELWHEKNHPHGQRVKDLIDTALERANLEESEETRDIFYQVFFNGLN